MRQSENKEEQKKEIAPILDFMSVNLEPNDDDFINIGRRAQTGKSAAKTLGAR